jgi:hypothetical protein
MFDPGTMGGTGLPRDLPPLLRTIGNYAFYMPRVVNFFEPGLQVSLKADSAKMLLRIMEEREMARGEPAGPARETGGAPYYSARGDVVQTHGQTNEPDLAKALWADSVQLLGMQEKDLAQ